MTRSEAREKCMVVLYQVGMYKDKKIEFVLEDIIKSNVEIENDFVNMVVNGVLENVEAIDETANTYMENWTINRIDKPGSEILRIALYELKFTDTPEIVVINEAIELAKKYSDDSVKNIINATLDKFIKER